MNVVFALILRIFSNPCANFIQKKLTSFESSLSVNFYSSVFIFLFSSPFLKREEIFNFGHEFYFLVLLSSLFCFLGTICLIKALSCGEMSVLGPINSYKSIIGLIFACFFLGETPSIKALLGFVLIIGSSFLFLDEKGRFILNKSVSLRLLALLFTGIEAVIIKRIILISSPLTAFIWWATGGIIFSFLFALIKGKIILKSKKSIYFCALTGFLLFIMQLSTNYVFKNMEVGLSLALFQLSSPVSLFLGFKFLKEKGIFKKSLGALIMLLGSFLILI